LKKLFYFSWFITVILLISGCQGPPRDTVIKIQPETSVVKVGDTIAIDILVEDVSDLMGMDLGLQFNPTVLAGQDADPAKDGIQLRPGSFLSPDFQHSNAIDNNAGLVQYVVVQLSPNEPAKGSGVVASIEFKAVATGVSELTFVKTMLASSEAQEINVTSVPGQVTVEE
jgi:hypothetical protein